jgi:hypothetical protein
MVYSMTRLRVPKQTFDETLLPIFTELEMQESWVERACPVASAQAMDGVDTAIIEFHGWLDANDRERRAKLAQPSAHSGLRRELAEELRRRFEA